MNNNLITIFRIEDKNGMGMYGGQQLEDDKSLWGQCVNIFQENLSHPVPCDDGLNNLPLCYKYAFSDIQQLKDWVYESDWLIKMAELGAVVKMLLIPFEHLRRDVIRLLMILSRL